MNAVDGVADILPGGDDDGEGQQDHGGDAPATQQPSQCCTRTAQIYQ